MSEIRKKIKVYLEIKKTLDIAASRIVNEKRDVRATAMDYRLNYTTLKKKVDILRKLNDYFEKSLLYENAIRSVMYEDKTPEEAESYFNLDHKIIEEEIKQYSKLNTKGPYEYDKPLDEKRIFTFKEELSLLDDLCQWIYKTSSCTCIICAMVQLLSLAYQFAREKNKLHPQTWNQYQQADYKWLIDFEMTHSCKLSKLCPYSNIQELYKTCKQDSSRFDKSRFNKTFNVDEPTMQTPQKIESIICQNGQNASSQEENSDLSQEDQTASSCNSDSSLSFATNRFENTSLNLTNYVKLTDNYNTSQKENFGPSQACSQTTNEVMNLSLDIPMERESKTMFRDETASTSFATNQFENILLASPYWPYSYIRSIDDCKILQKKNADLSYMGLKFNKLMTLSDIPKEQKSETIFKDQTASTSFATNQFGNMSFDLTNVKVIDNYNISPKENFSPSRACNQTTSEVMNLSLDTPTKRKLESEIMFRNETPSTSFATDQFENTLSDSINYAKVKRNKTNHSK